MGKQQGSGELNLSGDYESVLTYLENQRASYKLSQQWENWASISKEAGKFDGWIEFLIQKFREDPKRLDIPYHLCLLAEDITPITIDLLCQINPNHSLVKAMCAIKTSENDNKSRFWSESFDQHVHHTDDKLAWYNFTLKWITLEYAKFLIAQKTYEDAQLILEEGIRKTSYQNDKHLNQLLAKTLMALEDFVNAKSVMDKLREENPRDPIVLDMLGTYYRKIGKYEDGNPLV